MRTIAGVAAVLLLGGAALAGCATGRVAYRYEHPERQGMARNGDFVACYMTTGVDRGERFDRCLITKGYTPVYD